MDPGHPSTESPQSHWNVTFWADVVNLRLPEGSWGCSLAFSADGRRLIRFIGEIEQLQIWNINGGGVSASIPWPEAERGACPAMDFDPSGAGIGATAQGEGQDGVSLMDLGSQSSLQVLDGTALALRFHPAGHCCWAPGAAAGASLFGISASLNRSSRRRMILSGQAFSRTGAC